LFAKHTIYDFFFLEALHHCAAIKEPPYRGCLLAALSYYIIAIVISLHCDHWQMTFWYSTILPSSRVPQGSVILLGWTKGFHFPPALILVYTVADLSHSNRVQGRFSQGTW
jgi:hypothetical protein